MRGLVVVCLAMTLVVAAAQSPPLNPVRMKKQVKDTDLLKLFN